MSEREYQRKKAMIQTSAADYNIKTKALENLELEYRGVNQRKDLLLREIEAGRAELKGGEL